MDQDIGNTLFINWLNSLIHHGGGEIRGKDVVLTKLGSQRFSLGVVSVGTTKGTPVLGVNIHDSDAFNSIHWSSAGIIGGHDRRDWIALSCKDIRPAGSELNAPYPLRVWINFPIGSLDVFMQAKPRYLELRKTKNNKKGLPVIGETCILRLPLAIRNQWDDLG